MSDASNTPSGEAAESAVTAEQGIEQATVAPSVTPTGSTPPADSSAAEDVSGEQESTEAGQDAAASADASEDSSAPSASRLEEEGDIAADYVEELLDISDLDGDIDIEIRNGRTYVSVIAEEGDDRLRGLVGKDGKGLEALQELVRLAVLSATGSRSRLVLDVAGHRTERAQELEQLAQEAIVKVRETGEPLHLRPMGAYERKIVHDVIAEGGLVSESEGEGPRRHVVVSAGV
ncbi:R3H domain-containing nucleic acid-binding protein [Citricoccus sp. K5]|uniref:Jag family protein n=1 Tax=Citricoccus sp. K5 TaxID=2653135 RepID=UPI0012F18F32|nr:R3H domain-containing nucleic acid-binding protein [Citricoccus sp. K5]VXB97847.1 SpoIIIJ-associated protein [Citricoccus sp. K5]